MGKVIDEKKDGEMEYEIRESARATRLRITVYPEGRIVVTKPRRVSVARARMFLALRKAWAQGVQAKLARKAARPRREADGVELPRVRAGSGAHTEAVARARALAHERLPELNRTYGFEYGRISIRNQKTRWGSCSQKGNLNFNYRMAFLPPELAEYLLVHELCHTREMNHGPAFWALVEKSVPNYKKLRTQLRALSLQ